MVRLYFRGSTNARSSAHAAAWFDLSMMMTCKLQKIWSLFCLSSPPRAQVGMPLSRPHVTPWDNLIRHATGQWLTKTDSRVQAFSREVCAARFNTLWETRFLATFRLMLHIKNRGQPIRAVRQSGRAAIAQESGTQCLTKRVNVGLRGRPPGGPRTGDLPDRAKETEN